MTKLDNNGNVVKIVLIMITVLLVSYLAINSFNTSSRPLQSITSGFQLLFAKLKSKGAQSYQFPLLVNVETYF